MSDVTQIINAQHTLVTTGGKGTPGIHCNVDEIVRIHNAAVARRYKACNPSTREEQPRRKMFIPQRGKLINHTETENNRHLRFKIQRQTQTLRTDWVGG